MAIKTVTPLVGAVAASPSLTAATGAPPTVAGHFIEAPAPNRATPDLPQEFILAVPDDALGEKTPRGTRLIFRRADGNEAPSNGKGVLVQDNEGQMHIRVCQRDAVGQPWIAAARTRGYKSFDMSRGDAQLLGLVTYREAEPI